MIMAGALGGALLLLAAPAPGSLPPEPPPSAATQIDFAPPVGREMTYHVTTRRLGRDGALISFSLVYALQWQRAGRGYQLAATLQRIESDAPPEVLRLLSSALQPLVGETLTYLVAPDGRHVDMIDSDGLWERVAERTQALAAGADQPEARKLGAMLAALPAEERRRQASAEIRALVALANPDIPVAGGVTQDGAVRTIVTAEREILPIGEGARPLEIDNRWTIDTTTGLVLSEQRQTWIVEPGSKSRTLVEERMRVLHPGTNE